MVANHLPYREQITTVRLRRLVRRQGISLLEVIFSIGVIGVGLLGIAVLLSVAGKLAADGRTADNAARAGLNWVREFESRGYARPVNWAIADASSSAAYADPPPPLPPTFGNGPVLVSATARSFCIDPRFAAINGDSVFPYAATTTDPRMRRITLRSFPGGAMMGSAQATEICMTQDDLVFDRPTDSTLLATQNYAKDAATSTLKRNFDGRLSWLATLVPKMQANMVYRDEYTLSVIVVNNRDPAMSMTSMAPHPNNERVVSVANFYGAGIGGGDVRLSTNSANGALDLQLRRGDWLMLAAFNEEPYFDTNGSWSYNGGEPTADLNNNGAHDSSVPIFRWYRVLTADAPQLNGANWTVDVTLHGPDWNALLTTQATIVTGVVTVYEKTIRLDKTSLWTY